MKDYIEIGRRYKNGKDAEGEKILMEFDPTMFYKTNGQWRTYNPLSKKEVKINFPSL